MYNMYSRNTNSNYCNHYGYESYYRNNHLVTIPILLVIYNSNIYLCETYNIVYMYLIQSSVSVYINGTVYSE